MKTKKMLMIILVFAMLSFPTVASASIFYDVYGYTDVSWNQNGVNLYSYSGTTAAVDLLQVVSMVYVYGYYQGLAANSINDGSFISTSYVRAYYGTVDMLSTHTATDWTGDEITYTSDTYYR